MTRKMTARDLQARFGGISLRTISRWVEAGILPRPVRINGGYRFWDEEEVDRAFGSKVTRSATPDADLDPKPLNTLSTVR